MLGQKPPLLTVESQAPSVLEEVLAAAQAFSEIHPPQADQTS